MRRGYRCRSLPGSQAQQAGQGGRRKARQQSHRRGQGYGQQGPFDTVCLLGNGDAGGGARPMEQREEHGAYRRQPGPAVVTQKGPQGVQVPHVLEGAGGKIGHDENGHHNLVGGEAQQEGRQDGPVQPQHMAQRVQEAGTPMQNTGPAHGDIGAQPDDEPRRSRHRRRPPQNEERAVQYRAGDYLPNAGTAVGGKLQGKGGRDSLEDGARQQPGNPKGHAHPQKNHPRQQQGREQAPPRPPLGAHKEHGENGDKGGKTPIAGHETIGENGDEPLPGRVDNPAPHHPGGITAKAHTYRINNFAL